MSLNGITEQENTMFKIKLYDTRLSVYDGFDVRYVIYYKMGYPVKTVERSVYNLL